MRSVSQNPFRKSKSRSDFFESSPHHSRGDLIIVLDLDLTLVYSNIVKPTDPLDELECITVQVSLVLIMLMGTE